MKRTTSAKDIKQMAALREENTRLRMQATRWEARAVFLEDRAAKGNTRRGAR